LLNVICRLDLSAMYSILIFLRPGSPSLSTYVKPPGTSLCRGRFPDGVSPLSAIPSMLERDSQSKERTISIIFIVIIVQPSLSFEYVIHIHSARWRFGRPAD